MTKNDLENHLKHFIEPYYETDLITAKAIKQIEIAGNHVTIDIVLGFAAQRYETALKEALMTHLKKMPDIGAVTLSIETKISAHAVQKNLKPLPNVKNIIVIASAKGGVGKSTTAVNVALALALEGARVGILDADIYGPSIPTMLGLSGAPETFDNKTMQPKVAHGIQTMSIGYLVSDDQALIWRGPMVTNALRQLLNETHWDKLDYLIMDLPPGTGDIQLTLAQSIPVSGAIIVTTPQDIALLDVQRGLSMFDKVNIPVLGLVENMSTHICRQCGHEEAIFGTGGGVAMAEINKITCLGKLPLDIQIREHADLGAPVVMAQLDSHAAQIYLAIAKKMTALLALKPKDFSNKFPNIVIQSATSHH
jgi:ATP-binding protein involved in chromosome partitioning